MKSSLWRQIADLLYPPVCVRCNTLIGKGSALCDDCFDSYFEANFRICPNCFKSIGECTCTDTLLKNGGVKRLYKVFYYFPQKTESSQNHLIYALKRKHQFYAFDFLADELAALLKYHLADDITSYTLTYVPASKRRMQNEGYDQMRILAKHLSKKLEIPLEAALLHSKKKTKAQKHLTKEERLENAKDLFLPNYKVHLIDKKYILIDDVCTTGATLHSAYRTLKRSGAKAVECAVIAARPLRVKKTYHIKK